MALECKKLCSSAITHIYLPELTEGKEAVDRAYTKTVNMNKTAIAAFAAGILIMGDASAETNAEKFIGRQTPQIKERRLSPEALWAMGRIGGQDIAPDAKEIVYNVTYYSVEENKSHTVIYTMNADGSENKMLTTSTGSESAPKYIMGGKRIAYLAADNNGVSQIWSMNADGSDRKQISHFEKDVEDFMFSPDGKKVLLVQSIKYGKRTADIYPDLPKASGKIINDLMYRHWDEWVESIPHSYVAEFDGSEVKNAVDIIGENEPYECPMKPFGGVEQLAWSPDSRYVAYTCRKKTGLDYAISTDSDIYLYDTENGETKNLCKPAGYKAPKVDPSLSLASQASNKNSEDLNMGYDTNPSFSPDGKYIAWQSMKRDGYESDRNRICVMELATGKKTYVTEKFESNADSYCWDAKGKKIYFTGVWHGETHVYSTDIKGDVKKITEGQYDYVSVAVCGNKLLCMRQSMMESPELFSVDPKNGKAVQVTNENKYFRDNIDWGEVVPRWTKTVDNKDMLSWVILPPNFDKNKKYPTLLFCEGGPQSPVSQFWSYRWNMQIMAANGYIVVAPNRRGLPGFGMEWLEEISTNYGGHCMDDYLSAIDDIAKEPYVDKDRLGCVGASFGGFSVYWLAGHHDKRFKCFIAHDGIFNLEQQYVETEESWFANWDMGGAYWHKENEAVKRTFANSPHLFVDKWDVPILCIHGEKDFRIVASQAMAAFNAARYRGIDAQLLIFPDENHWVLKPQNGVLWQRTFFGWLDKWLKK